jgi:MoaA/NifB/PqqE/SkfB family radical SAM enzyme
MDGDISTCVYGKELLGNLQQDPITDILQTTKLKEIKDNLYNDIQDYNCSHCGSYENAGENQSYNYIRDLYNPMFIKSEVNYSQPQDFVLSGIDLHWSSLCNLKCITCSPEQSSSIALEQKIKILHTPTEKANKLIDYIIENQCTLKEIYLSGGEPTLIKYNLKLLQSLNKREDLRIRINTNMTFDCENQIVKELKKFPNVLITISADSISNKFNYIRRGADWNVFLKNLEMLQKHKNFRWRLNSVFFVCSAVTLLETFDYFTRNFQIEDFTINQLQMGHTAIRSRNLNNKIKKKKVNSDLLKF